MGICANSSVVFVAIFEFKEVRKKGIIEVLGFSGDCL